VSRAVHLAGTGLACALGMDLPCVLAALRRGGMPPGRTTAGGAEWPLYALPPQEGDWEARASRTVRRVAAESGALAERTGPLYVASSSRDIGQREDSLDFSGDIQVFAERVAQWLDWRGPVLTVSTACTSAATAALAAARWIGAGEADHALVLGVELDNRFTVAGFGALQLLASADAQGRRNGLVLGQAVAALHLRAQPARWRLAGGANVADGRNPTGTQAEAVVAACREALRSAGLQPGDIGLLKPHAAGNAASDAAEAEALVQVFGALPPMVSLKAAIGHTLGAAAAAELALLVACLEAGVRPAPDPVLGDWPGAAAAWPATAPRHLLLATIGFGGGHAALVLTDGQA